MTDRAETKILNAAITCLERHGVAGTGIREIAAEAGVNSAAINYYFRSKENLLRQALAQTLDQAFGQVPKDLDRLIAGGLDSRRALEELVAEYLFNAARYPRIAFANLHEVLAEQRYTAPCVALVHTLLDTLAEKLTTADSRRSRDDLRLGLAQIWAAIVSWAMAPELFATVQQLDVRDIDQCRRWARRLVSILDAP